VLVRNCAAELRPRGRGGGRFESGRLRAVVIVVAAVVGADGPGEGERRSGRTAGGRGGNTNTRTRGIEGRRSAVRAVSRRGVNEGLVLELANTVADNLACGVGLLQLWRYSFTGSVCDSEAGGPENGG
jgi:hypothetical protein